MLYHCAQRKRQKKSFLIVNIFFPLGAGDAFVGGFLHAFLKGRSPSIAARYACRAAAAVIGRLGAEPPNKPPPDLEDFQDEIKEVCSELTG